MPQETDIVDGLNPFNKRRQAHPGLGAFRREQFDTAVGSGEQQQALKASTYARVYEPDVFLAAEGGSQFLGLVENRIRADIERVPGSLEPLFPVVDPLLVESSRAAWNVSDKNLLKWRKIVADLLNIPIRAIEVEFAEQQWHVAALIEDLIEASEDSAPAPERDAMTGRAIGPVQFFEKLLGAWGLDEQDGATLLGFEETSRLRDLLRGTVSLRGRDTEDRLAYLLDIDFALNALFRDEELIRAWLHQPLEELGGETPLDHLLKGSMENLLRLNQFVEFLSGR